MKKTIFITFILLIGSVNLWASSVDSSILNLSKEKQVEFDKLPEFVQKLMIKDAEFRIQVEKKNEAKSKTEFLKLFSTDLQRDCENDRNPNDITTCVPNCTWRSSDGTCNSYGPDYCGPGAHCSENCTWRSSDGSCNSYGSDYCGENAYCSPNCTWRSSDGSCNSYGPDVCN